MNQMVSLPVGSYPFASAEGRHRDSAHEHSLATGDRAADFYADDSAVNNINGHAYSLHEEPAVAATVAQHVADGSYHHDSLISHAGAHSSEYGRAAASSLSNLANYSALSSAPLHTSAELPSQYTPATQSYTASNGYSQPFHTPTNMRMLSMVDQQSPAEVMRSERQNLLDNSVPSSIYEGSRRNNYTTTIPDRSFRTPSTLQRRHEAAVPKTPSYSTVDSTPRSLYSPMSISPQYSNHYSSASYSNSMSQSESSPNVPPFTAQKTLCELWGGLDNIRKRITPALNCRIEKGFFQSPSDGCYTCYRRNYFSVCCDYNLTPLLSNEPLYVTHEGTTHQVQALSVCLSAAVDGPNGKSIELVQYTPKRDAGDKNPVTMKKLLPMPASTARAGHHEGYPCNALYTSQSDNQGPLLPLQHSDRDTNTAPTTAQGGPNGYTTTFERIQFKSATANNGKRRAQQQYYHISVELWADVRKSSKDNSSWVKIAQKTSEPVVVRGRSPSHYKNEGHHGSADFRGAGGAGGSGSGLGPYSYGSSGAATGRGYGLTSSGGGHTSLSSNYRLATCVEQPNLELSPTSPLSSMSASPVDTASPVHELGLRQNHIGQILHRSNCYEYFPQPLVGEHNRALVKSEHSPGYGIKAETITSPGAFQTTLPSVCSRYVNLPIASSRGLYGQMTGGY